jgi:leucyl/phenylalanyl-tRNA--protein transferase
MFSRARDASKIALAALVAHLESAGFGLIDCQMRTRHLESLGAREIPRRRFSRLLEELIHYPHAPGSWAGASLAQVQCRS